MNGMSNYPNSVLLISTMIWTTAWSSLLCGLVTVSPQRKARSNTIEAIQAGCAALCVAFKSRHMRNVCSAYHPLPSPTDMFRLQSVFAVLILGLVRATLVKRQAITALSSAQIDAFAPLTHFASAAYCNPSTTINWSCGGAPIAIDTLVNAHGIDRCFYSQLRRESRLPTDGVRGGWLCHAVL
jgi:hypothetical protein